MKHHIAIQVSGAVAAGSLFLGVAAQGAGFALMEHSVSGIGRSYAGSTAGADLESSVYYNPAGIAGAERTSVVVGSHLLMSSVDFDGGSSYPALGGFPVTGGDGGEAGVNTLIPNVYAVMPVADGIAVGLGLFVPFGLAVDYNEGWVGRYHALESSLETININPSVGWQVTDNLSVGAGFSAQYAEATLSSAIDFATPNGAPPGVLDGKGEMNGDDWGYGFDLGLLYTITDSSRVGLSYRSAIKHTLEGRASFDVPALAAGIQALGLFVDTTGSAEVELPASASLGCVQELGDRFALMMDIVWTEWSSFDELRIEYDSNQADSVTDESWNDTWRVMVGGEYYANADWTLRGGIAFDESPVPDVAHRTPRIPDTDRMWLTAGLGYRASENVAVDFGYAHVFSDDAKINQMSATGDNLVGDYAATADVFSLQVAWDI
jgi:long-chain fatty acid transport protein